MSSRVLSDEGRAQMIAIGDGLRAFAIPVARVQTSEYCRAFESGVLLQLMPVTTNPSLNFADAQRSLGRTEAQMTADVRKLFGTSPPPRANVILIGHVHGYSPPVNQVFNEMIEGEAAVLKPLPDGSFELIGRIAPDNWATRAK